MTHMNISSLSLPDSQKLGTESFCFRGGEKEKGNGKNNEEKGARGWSAGPRDQFQQEGMRTPQRLPRGRGAAV